MTDSTWHLIPTSANAESVEFTCRNVSTCSETQKKPETVRLVVSFRAQRTKLAFRNSWNSWNSWATTPPSCAAPSSARGQV
ncbi:unnamed protein product [Merluccius merluccius]